MPKFTPEYLDELKSRLRISDVVGRHVKLQRRGNAWWGLSPFKTEKTPSFTVNDDRRSYHCFSTDNHGDAIKFLQETQGLSFIEAVTRLAQEAGMTLPAEDPKASEKAKVRKGLADACAAAAQFFIRQLHGKGGREAAAYLFEKRGLTREICDAFELGFAPVARTGLRDHLLELGFSEVSLVEAGLVIKPDDGGPTFDRFRGRVMFPIRRGKDVIAFGGRALDPNAKAKYLNSPETPIFKKGSVLYNFDAARSAISSARARGSEEPDAKLIVCEGYMDVIALWGAGFKGGVAPLGTALTEDQISLCWRVDDEPVLSLDGDEAGLKAAHRALDRALPMLAPGRSLSFAFMPSGQDPDDFIRDKGRAAYADLVAQSEPLVNVLWEREAISAKTDTPERRTAFKRRLRELVRSIGDADVQSGYAQEFANRLNTLFAAGAPRLTGSNAQSNHARPSASKGPARRYGAPLPARPTHQAKSSKGGLTLKRCEATLVALLIARPEILADHEDTLMLCSLRDPDLDLLLSEIIAALVARPDLDSEGLRKHLMDSRAANQLRHLQNDEWLMRQTFLRPAAEPHEAKEAWRATWGSYQWAAQGEQELNEAGSSIFSAGEDAWIATATAVANDSIFNRDSDFGGSKGDGASSDDLSSSLDRLASRFR
ncbi:MAG: DNA primase [Pseudomonadota bacterium]